MNESAPSFNEPLPADGRLPRRTVLKWFAAAAVAVELQPLNEIALGAAAPALKAKGYGTDPNVAGYFKPGDYWPLTLTGGQRRAGVALADLLFPADKFGPAASELRVIDFIDEWISAPYPDQMRDRAEILPGLQWMDDESNRRFKREFAALADAEKRTICDDICWPADAAPKMKMAAAFFQKFRSLAAGAYYSTEPGWEAIGYVGNAPQLQFDGPPTEVLDLLGVEQTVR